MALSGDRQRIHSDLERAKVALPAGRTIVPGNLLLVQLPRLLPQVYTVAVFEKCMVEEYRHIVDANVRLFLQAKVLSVTPTRGFVRVETAREIHFAETRRPALTATIVDLFYDAQ